VVESDGLLNRYTLNRVSGVRIPLSPPLLQGFATNSTHFSLVLWTNGNKVATVVAMEVGKSSLKPILVRRSGLSVRIYPRTRGDLIHFQVADYSSGKRRLVAFPTLAEAKTHAELVATRLASPDRAVLELKTSDRAAYLRAAQLIAPLKVPLEMVASEYVEARRILGDRSLIQAARFYVQKNPDSILPKAVKDVIQEFLADKAAKRKSDRYLADLKYRCERFGKSFSCPIGDITTAQIEKFLMELKLSSQSYENFRRAIGTLFAFAKRRGYVPRDHGEFDQVERVRAENGEIEIFSPAELEKLLRSADSDFLPCIAISAFAGLRSSEVERLSWQDVKLAEKVIVVQKGKTKTGSRRLAPISDNLATWITPLAQTSGPVWPFGHEPFYKAQQDTARAAAVPWKQNALRHSFISYRLAIARNEQQVAFESGNSPSMVHKHYKQLVTQPEAEKWFAVVREQPTRRKES
jgi:integrase